MKKTSQPIQTTAKGFKVTDSNMRCRGYQYEIGKEYSHDGRLQVCDSGFHFCEIADACFNYYSFDSNNRVFEVEASGEIITEGDKSCCSRIKFIREFSWDEVLKLVNTGKDNTGRGNTGDRNTGYSNTGDRNTGYRNTGYSNTGDRNTGDWNTGDRNTGDRNTGDWNTGDRNTGDWNTGDRNTGYSNTGDRNTGVFCTGEPATIKMFNKESSWTEKNWLESTAYRLMCNCVDTKMWVDESVMTEEEKQKFPSSKTAGGYIKDIPFKEAFSNAWHNFSDANKKTFTSLPNFDAAIFETITGVKI